MTALDDALADRLRTAGVKRVYKLNEVPQEPVAPYCVISVDTGTTINRRTLGPGTKRYRMSVRMLGPSVDAWWDMARLADLAFEDQVLDELDGDPYCVREFATVPVRDPDAGTLIYGLHTYRF